MFFFFFENKSPTNSFFFAFLQIDFRLLVKEMKSPIGGIQVRDRPYYTSQTQWTTFRNCFIGSEAVDWLVKKNDLHEREPAILIFQHLLSQGVIQHVSENNMQFEDNDQFYRFVERE